MSSVERPAKPKEHVVASYHGPKDKQPQKNHANKRFNN
jgi:hypothetical protein